MQCKLSEVWEAMPSKTKKLIYAGCVLSVMLFILLSILIDMKNEAIKKQEYESRGKQTVIIMNVPEEKQTDIAKFKEDLAKTHKLSDHDEWYLNELDKGDKLYKVLRNGN